MGARHTLPSWLTFPSTTLPFLVPISRCKLRHPCLALGSVPACAFKSASSEASNWRRKVPRRTGHRGSGPQSTPSKAPRCPIHDACAGPQAREGRLTCLARRDAYLANPATATSNIHCRESLPGPGQACLRCAALRWGRHPPQYPRAYSALRPPLARWSRLLILWRHHLQLPQIIIPAQLSTDLWELPRSSCLSFELHATAS